MKEGARDNAFQMFLPLFQKRGIEMNVSQLKQMMLRKLTSEAGMHNLSLRSNYYLLGATRYYFEGKLTTNTRLNALYPNVSDKFIPDICKRLDALVLILRNAYIDTVGTQFEQPEDFGNLSLEKLLKKYNKKINKELGLDKKDEDEVPNANNDYSAGNGYTYDILYSYEDAQKYNEYTEPGAWCITYGKAHYDGYIKRLGIHYVIFRQNGFENVPRRMGNGFTKRKPHDAYGNSLIAVLQSNRSPEPIFITSRWNHGYYNDGTQGTEADHAYTKEEFLNVIGSDYSVLEMAYEQWKAVSNGGRKSTPGEVSKFKIDSVRAAKYAQMLINGGKNPMEVEWLSLTPIGNQADDSKARGAYLVKINIGSGIGSKYYTIMDRRHLFLDKVFIKAGGVETTINKKGFCLLYFDDVKLPYIIYDLKRHSVLDLDDEHMFKEVSSYFRRRTLGEDNEFDAKYAFLAISGNQVAAVKTDTLEPIRAKNGSAWFEAITWCGDFNSTNYQYDYTRRGVRLPWDDNSGIIRMTYDSSAEERYYYNTITESFVDFGIDLRLINHIQPLAYGDTKYYYLSILLDNGRYAFKIYSAVNNSYVQINGEDIFAKIMSHGTDRGMLVLYKPLGKEYYMLYNVDQGKHVTANGNNLALYDKEINMRMLFDDWLDVYSYGNKNGYGIDRHIPIDSLSLSAPTIDGELMVGVDIKYTWLNNYRAETYLIFDSGGRINLNDLRKNDHDTIRAETRKFKELYRRITEALKKR